MINSTTVQQLEECASAIKAKNVADSPAQTIPNSRTASSADMTTHHIPEEYQHVLRCGKKGIGVLFRPGMTIKILLPCSMLNRWQPCATLLTYCGDRIFQKVTVDGLAPALASLGGKKQRLNGVHRCAQKPDREY